MRSPHNPHRFDNLVRLPALWCVVFALVTASACGSDADDQDSLVIINNESITASPGEENPVSTVICDSFDCTEEYCEDACQRQADCGLLTGDGALGECLLNCDSLDIGFRPERSDSDCPTLFARSFDCNSRASCTRLAAAREASANPVCEEYDDKVADACFYGEPRMVALDVLGFVIAPAKANGNPWDGTGSAISAEDWAQFVDLIASVAGSRVVAAASDIVGRILNFVNQATAPPDPYGFIRWDYGEGWVDAVELFEIGNTFLPTWSLGSYMFEEGSSVRWNVRLDDADISEDDPINSVVFTSEDVEKAARLGVGDTWIVVGDRVNPQLAAIKVSATYR